MGKKLKNMTDTNLLLTITIVVFFVMYIGAIVFQGKGFLKPQTFFNILNANAALIILSCGMSLVMITGGIDISVGGVVCQRFLKMGAKKQQTFFKIYCLYAAVMGDGIKLSASSSNWNCVYLSSFEKTPHKENVIPVTNKIIPIISTGNNPISDTVCQYLPHSVFHSVVFSTFILAIKEVYNNINVPAYLCRFVCPFYLT